jgi:hypothetical protein
VHADPPHRTKAGGEPGPVAVGMRPATTVRTSAVRDLAARPCRTQPVRGPRCIGFPQYGASPGPGRSGPAGRGCGGPEQARRRSRAATWTVASASARRTYSPRCGTSSSWPTGGHRAHLPAAGRAGRGRGPTGRHAEPVAGQSGRGTVPGDRLPAGDPKPVSPLRRTADRRARLSSPRPAGGTGTLAGC